MNNTDQLVVNNIRTLAVEMIDSAGSGHPGIALSAAPLIYSIYANHLKFSSVDGKWINRDRFVMSAGHGSALLYSMLYFAGLDLTPEELKNFRKIDTRTPGHPEYGITPGVDATTGPLGQGFATAVGIALGERFLNAVLQKHLKGSTLIDYNTYVICGDGDLMEGISYEAASFAGTQKLNKLIVLYDSNDICLDGETKLTFKDDIQKRFEAMGWNYQLVKDGNDLSAIDKAIKKAKENKEGPSIIEVKTIIGYGSYNAGKNVVHGKPLTKEDINLLKDKFGIPKEEFFISDKLKKYLKEKINYRMDRPYGEWVKAYNDAVSSDYAPIRGMLDLLTKGILPEDINMIDFRIDANYKDELRNSNYMIINKIAARCQYFLGGSADLSSSCKTIIGEDETFVNSSEDPLARNIYFGVREHAMGAVLNGLALTGLRPFGSTFLSFSDYMKPAIRMSAMMNLPVTYIFTHDSVSIGEDGPTHEPVEQLVALRSIPNLTVYRPSDVLELYGAWRNILKTAKPSVLIVSKMEMEINKGSNLDYVQYGAYVVKMETSRLDGVIIATGSEVRTALLLAKDLLTKDIDVRVVSMPSIELFNKTNFKYQEELLPKNVKHIVLEAGSPYSWYQFVNNKENVIGIDTFGYSGAKNDVLKKLKFDYITLRDRIETILR